nr:putative ribonuclease H-like domain-containing protein [Tanacetum cinerariifolium]
MNIQSTSAPSTHTNVHAEKNNYDQAEEGEQLQDNEFTNPLCAPTQEEVESSSHNLGNSNVPTFNQPQVFEYQWTKDHPLEQDETPEVLKDFITMIQRNLQDPVITVRTDRGTEFLNKTLNAFFKEEGIEHQTSTARTPEQNGIVERWNCTLVEAARMMLSFTTSFILLG